MKPANFAPVYASIYPELAEIFREHGYALAIHGTLAKDFDLIAVPWIEKPVRIPILLARLESEFGLIAQNPNTREHGRFVYSMVFKKGHTMFLDLSFCNAEQLV